MPVRFFIGPGWNPAPTKPFTRYNYSVPIPDPTMHFIDEPITVLFDTPPLLEKSPTCPQGFIWRGETYRIVELLAEWKDFRRRGRMGRNMIPPHLTRAQRIGSLGVGRFYFQVRVENGQIFDLYYDRAPVDADQRKGNWVLLSERFENPA